MNPFAVWRFVRNIWNGKDSRSAKPRKSPQRRSFRPHVENLEERTVMSTLPAPVISDQYNLLGQSSVQMAVDPLDPQRIIAVAGNGGLAAAYTHDGGVTWNQFAIPTSGLFGSAADASVTFDGQGYFHVANIEYNGTLAARTAGQVVVHTFDWIGNAPNLRNGDAHVNWVYRWSGIDAAYNTSIGADTNVLTWTDPQDNTIQYEPTTLSESTQTLGGRAVPKALYVAWNNDWTSTGSQTMIAATPYGNSDLAGGNNSAGFNHAWTTVQRVSGIGGAAPQIIFPQKSPNEDIPPGLMAIFYQTTGGGVNVDITQPDGGNQGQQVASTAYFSADGANLGTFNDATLGVGTDANGNPNPDGPSSRSFDIVVDFPTEMTTINDLDLKLTFSTTDLAPDHLYGDLSTIEMVLTPPAGSGLQPITLLRNRIDGRGNTRLDGNNPQQPIGLPAGIGRDMGVLIGTEYFHTVFDDDAPRSITQPGFNVPFAGHFRPEGSFINAPGGVNFFGQNLDLNAAALEGTWTLTITDTRNNRVPQNTPNPRNILRAFELHFSGIIEDGMDAVDQTVSGGRAVAGSGGSNFSVAQDTTVGLNSQFAGRIYVATSTGDIFVNSADRIVRIGNDYSALFGAAVKVNDDTAQDNFSEGNRDQYLPAISVDRSTGTLVVTYNDARWDAANLRYTTMISTSIDGGDSFAPSAWLNETKTAIDFLTGDTIEIEPIPGNNGGSTAISGAGALGRRNAVVVYQGKVNALYGSNRNDSANQTWTGRFSIAAGPRVVGGDMGIVNDFQTVTDNRGTQTTSDDITFTYNDTYTDEGVRRLTGFVIEFDRPIDRLTFNPNDFKIEYRDPFTSTDNPANDTTITIGQIIALDAFNTFGYHDIGGDGSLATKFLVLFSQPQTRVGTYSYAISPMIKDRMRDPFGRIVPGQVASFEPQGAQQNLSFGPENIFNNSDVAESIIDLSAAGFSPARLRDLTVEVNIQHPRSSRLRIELIAPGAGNSILLHDSSVIPSGSNFENTLFDGAALLDINRGSPPFSGAFRPDETMAEFIAGVANVNGPWRLRVTNFDSANGGTLVSWKLNIQTGQTESLSTGFGNYMDQNSDGWSADGALASIAPVGVTQFGIRESASRQYAGDRFAVPNPVSGVPFQLPYTTNSLPLMISGPHLEQVARSEVQTLDFVANSGVFRISLPGIATPTVGFAPNASAAQVQAGLEAIGGAGNFLVTKYNTGETGSRTVFQIQFRGAFAGRNLDPVTIISNDMTIDVRTLTQGTRGVNIPGVTPTNGESLAVNRTVNEIELEFDRKIQVSSFTATDVLEIIGPYGRINLGTNNANVTITAMDDVGGFAKVFRVGFPTQELSGSYSIVLGSDIQAIQVNNNPTFNGVVYKMDNNQNAGLDVLRGTNPNNAALSSGEYARNNLNLAIGANQTTTFDLDVPNSFIVSQTEAVPIQFTFNLTHDDVRHLSAQLVSPSGQTITLFNNLYTFGSQPGPSPASANMQNVTLVDFANEVIQDGAPPYNSGLYKPTQVLGTFVGEQAQGTWQLRITNTSTTLTGNLESFQLKLPRVIPGSGVGEAIGDRSTAAFRIFVGDPSNDIVRENWTPVGPQTNNNNHTGRIGAIAVDPSDPSGNIVFAAGATGGIWKTSNFLTTDPNGPTWIPLTDFGPTMAMNVGHIATYARNNNPNETIVVVSTGDNDEFTWNGGNTDYQQPNRYPGIGFLISEDGGINWKVLDSTNNGTGAVGNPIKSINDLSRDRLFVGSKVNKVIFDPTPLSDGKIVMYAAVTGLGTNAANQRGVWRSLDTGRTWTRISSVGDATDIVLAAASKVGTGQLNILYAGIQGQGVYFSQNATTANPTMSLLDGGDGTPLRVSGGGGVISVANPANTPTGAKGRILLAAPPKITGNVLQDTFYQGWLYALVLTSGGQFDGLYMTKDFGANWTDVKIPGFVSGTDLYPTNDESKAEINLFRGAGNTVSSLTIDPNDPNVIYIGGNLQQRSGYTEAFVRLDVSTISDPYAVVAFDNSDPGAGPTQAASIGAVTASSFTYGIRDNYDLTDDPIGGYYNMMRHPINQFDSNSAQIFSAISSFNNEGTDIKWSPFNHFYDGSTIPAFNGLLNNFGHNRAIAITDEFTGKTRLIVGSFDGIYTAVDDGEGNLHTGAGFYEPLKGTRTGNLQLTQFTAGAIQPSNVAADAANSVFYGIAVGLAITQSSDTILQDGVLDWTSRYGGAEMVVTDPTGTGRTYQFRWPGTINQSPFFPREFFLITRPNQNTLSFTNGLVQNTDFPENNVGQWPILNGSAFAVSPIDNRSLVISSQDGRIFRATPSNANGTQWFEIAAPADLNSTYASALAFGAPATYPTSNPADFIYAGTQNGRVYTTFVGGGIGTAWKNLGSPDPTNAPIISIQANPKANSADLYVATRNGVWYMADSRAAAPTWVNITGSLFAPLTDPLALTRPMFNDPNELIVPLRPNSLTDLVADWRFAIPDDINNPNGPTHPALYVSGWGGVYRTITKGANTTDALGNAKNGWQYYPNIDDQDATQDGGYLPNVEIRDLDIAVGNTNTTSGFPDQSTGLNMLVAYTYGRGAYGIKLDNSQIFQYLTIPNSGPKVKQISPISPNPGTTLTGIRIEFEGSVDPISFTTGDVISITGPNGQIVPVTVVDATPTPAPGQPNLHNIYHVTFATQTVSGQYSIHLGVNIVDYSGNQMNNDGDNINGEATDEYTGSFNFVANVKPELDPIAVQVGQPNQAKTVELSVSDPTNPISSLTFSVPNTYTGSNIVPKANIAFSFNATTQKWSVTLTPAINAGSGTVIVPITVTDPFGLTDGPENLTVHFNQVPTFTMVPSPAPSEHGDPVNVNFTVTDPDAGTFGSTYNYYAEVVFADAQAATLDQQYGLIQYTGHANDGFNVHGLNEKYFIGTTPSAVFVILPDGKLYRHNGGAVIMANLTLIASLDPKFHLRPELLYEAVIRQAPTNPVTLSFTGGAINQPNTKTLVVTPPVEFVGKLLIKARVEDTSGGNVLSTSADNYLSLTVTNVAPTLNPISDVSSLHDTPIGPITYTASDGDNDPLTYHAQVVLANQTAVNLDQTNGLVQYTGHANDGFNVHGLNEKYIIGTTPSAVFVILQDGKLYRHNGGAVIMANLTLVANLDANYWLDPSLLYNAVSRQTAPNLTTLQSNVNVPATGGFYFNGSNQLFIYAPTGYVGSIVVNAFVNDGVVNSASQFFKATFTNNAPTLAAISDVSALHDTPIGPITYTASDGDNDPLTYHAQVVLASQIAVNLDQNLGLFQYQPGDAFNVHGQNEKWMLGTNSQGTFAYVIFDNGELKRYVNSTARANMVHVANLDPTYWIDPSLLYNAVSRQSAPNLPTLQSNVNVPASGGFYFNGNQLTIYPPTGYVGSIVVNAFVNDGVTNSASQFFKATFTNNAPTLAAISDVSALHDTPAGPVTYTANSGDSGETLTYHAQVVLASQIAVNLDQNLGLFQYQPGDAFNVHGQNEKWMLGTNSQGTFAYAIFDNGELKRYVNSTARANMVHVANLDPTYWIDPSLLYDAVSRQSAPNLPTLQSNSNIPASGGFYFNGNQLTIYPPQKYVGSIVVKASVSDGAQSAERFFKATFHNSGPTLAITPDQSSYSMASGGSLNLGLTINDADGDTVTTTAEIVGGFNRPADLDAQFNFVDYYQPANGFPVYNYNKYGEQEKWLISQNRTTGQYSNSFAIKPNGHLYSITSAPNPFGTDWGYLGEAYYQNPSLLVNAFENSSGMVNPPQLSNNNTQLTLSTSSGYIGYFDVRITVSDGIVATSRTIRVNVS